MDRRDKTFLEEHILNLLKQAAELEVEVAQNLIVWEHWRSIPDDKRGEPPEWLVDNTAISGGSFRYTLTCLYESVLCYLDQNDLTYLSEHFLRTFGKDFTADHATHVAQEFKEIHIGGKYNVFLSTLRRFLGVFPFASNSPLTHGIRPTRVLILENILKNTAQIIYEMKAQPKSEPDVYKAVKHVIKAAFPSAKDATSNFCKTAKHYKPDILVPELEVAIEYKYADSEVRLKSVVDEIHADVSGYTGDADYREFYAVFYVTEDFWGEDRFQVIWKEKKFPNNWKGYYKVGKGKT